MDDLNKELKKIMDAANNQKLPDFGGYSPSEMHEIIRQPLEATSPVRLKKTTTQVYQSVPLFNQVKYFLNLIKTKGELKLTAKGFLPIKLVADIYAQGFVKEETIESGLNKLNKEQDSQAVTLTRILPEIGGMTKKKGGKLSLTKKGENLLTNDYDLLKQLWLDFGNNFNWAYFDGYGDNHIGQLGFAFSLALLGRYGKEKRESVFYANKYIAAFPQLIAQMEDPGYTTKEENAQRCYAIRTFDRFLYYFGIITIEKEDKFGDPKNVIVTDLFEELIEC